MRLSHILIVSVPVSDQEVSKTFYIRMLGFELVRDNPMPGMRWIELGLPGSPTHLVLVDWFPQMLPGSMQGLVIETDDVQSVYESLNAQEVQVTEVETAPWGRYVTVSDPDGNSLVIQQSTRME